MSRMRRRVIQCLASVLVLGFLSVGSAWAAACSAYKGQAFINEVRIGSTTSLSTSNQVEIFNSANLASTVWKTWKIQIYYRSNATATPIIYTYPLSAFASNGQFIYNTGSMYLRNRTRTGRGLDIALLDSAGNYIDYIAMGFSLQTVPACMPVNVVSFSSTTSQVGDLARLTDAGNWPNPVTPTATHTIGASNQCSAGVSDLSVSQSVDNLTPLLNTTLVTYTISVTNKSCTNTINGVQVNTSNLLASNFSGLTTAVSTGSVATVGSNLVWTVGNMAKANVATLTVRGTPTRLGALTSTASVAAPTTGLSKLTDDSSAVTINVRDFNYVGFDSASDTLTEGTTTLYSASISSGIVPTSAITVNYTITGTATAADTSLGALPKSGSVTIDPTSADAPNNITIDFSVLNDVIYEPTKTITLTIDSVTSSDASVRLDPAASTMTLTLDDDDMPPVAAEYRFDTSSALDSSGNNRNGTLSGGVTTGAVGKVCGGYAFNGSSQYVNVAGLSSLLNGTASLSFWINTTQTGGGSSWTSPGVTGIEQSGGVDDIFWGWINPTGMIAVSKGNTLGALSSSSISNGVWRHVVLTRDQATGLTNAYVDGVLENTAISEAGVVTSAFTSIGRIQNSNGSAVYLLGSLDEVKVFTAVLSSTQVSSIYANESAGNNWDGSARVCPISGPHHMEIVHASGTGLTCTASTLTVRACADAACASLYTGGVSGMLTATGTPVVNWDGTTGGASGAGFSISSGSSSVTKNVQVTSAGSVVFGVTAPTTPASSNATTCNFGSPACTFTASAAGFIFDVPHHVSEVLQTVNVSAVKTADNSLACVPAFASVSKTVTFKCSYASPASGTVPVRVNGTSLNAAGNAASSCDVSGKAVSLSFGATGVASTTFQYADAGNVGVTATYTGSGLDAGLTMSGSDTFIAAPKDFAFSAVTASPIQAGSSFSATVTARNNANAATPNFINQTVTITSSNPLPTLGNATLINTTLAGFSSGAASTSLVWNEVGTVDLNANLTNYLGSGLSVSGVNAATGRFQPAYFDVAVTPACGAFTYAGSVTPAKPGQPFVVTVKAKRLGGGATDATNTANYAGGNAFLTTLSNAGAATGLSNNTIATTGFLNGIGAANITYAGVTEKVAPTTLVMRAVNSDTPAVSSAGHAEGTSDLRSGRLRLQNAYGSELLPLPVPLESQYWTGTYFATNAADNCTAFAASSMTLGGYTGGLAACETQITPAGSLGLVAGKLPGAGLVLTKPGSGNGGSVNLAINEGTTASGNTCVSATASAASAANLPWFGPNLGARATFGIYKSPLIYRRENY